MLPTPAREHAEGRGWQSLGMGAAALRRWLPARGREAEITKEGGFQDTRDGTKGGVEAPEEREAAPRQWLPAPTAQPRDTRG